MRSRDRLYAVVDAARDKDLAFAARDDFGLEHYTLFEGAAAPHLDHVGPHLVPIDLKSGYLELWSQHLGRSAGVLLITQEETEPLLAHLRKIFTVTDDENKVYNFRYYDPRVLRAYLPTCTGPEAQEFFGPIRRVIVEAEAPDRMLSFEASSAGAQMDERGLQQEEATRRDGGSHQ
jgi:hypothetical protein